MPLAWAQALASLSSARDNSRARITRLAPNSAMASIWDVWCKVICVEACTAKSGRWRFDERHQPQVLDDGRIYPRPVRRRGQIQSLGVLVLVHQGVQHHIALQSVVMQISDVAGQVGLAKISGAPAGIKMPQAQGTPPSRHRQPPPANNPGNQPEPKSPEQQCLEWSSQRSCRHRLYGRMTLQGTVKQGNDPPVKIFSHSGTKTRRLMRT